MDCIWKIAHLKVVKSKFGNDLLKFSVDEVEREKTKFKYTFKQNKINKHLQDHGYCFSCFNFNN